MYFYQAADFFLFRSANLPLEKLEDVQLDQMLRIVEQTPLFKEAISLASPSLAESLAQSSRQKGVKQSLLKYYCRMASRATPFGLFAAIGFGQMGNKTSLYFDPGKIQKTPKMQIPFCSYKDIYVNPHVVEKGNVLILPLTLQKLSDCISIRKTESWNFLANAAKEPILYSDLEQKLLQQYPQVEKEQITTYLQTLIRNKFLLTEDEEPKAQSIDALYTDTSLTLHSNVQKALEEAAQSIWRIALLAEPEKDPIYSWFLHKYGIDRQVPLLEFIADSEVYHALCAPEKKTQHLSLFASYLFSQLRDKEIDLAPLLDKVPPIDPEKLPPSMELYYQINSDSQESIDQNQFELIITGISSQAGASFGRFVYLWNEKHKLEQLLKKEEQLLPQLAFVNASYVLNEERFATLSSDQLNRTFRIHLAPHTPDETILELEDIWIGASTTHLYALSRKLNKQLHVSLLNMLNPKTAPLALQLLLSISAKRFLSPNASWTLLDSQTYVPAIRYRNIVFTPARWRFTYQSLQINETHTIEQISSLLKQELQKWPLPNAIMLARADGHFCIQWRKEHFFALLIQQFMRDKEITLFEHLLTPNRLIVKGKDGSYMSEFVSPLLKRQPYTMQPPLPPSQPAIISLSDRVLLPKSGWLYAKLQILHEETDRFLFHSLRPFMRKLETEIVGLRWFYVRYKEERFHVRLRIKADPDVLRHQVLLLWDTWIESLLNSRLIDDVSLHPYEREIERYGGLRGISLAEEFFYQDSCHCIAKLSSPKFPMPIEASLGICEILHQCGLSQSEQLQLLEASEKERHYLRDTRKHTSNALVYIKQIQSNPVNDSLTHLMEISAHKKFSVADSLIHMHCNRLMGPLTEHEKEARVLALHFLQKSQNARNFLR